MSSVSTFKGLNNVSDPLRLGLAWLAQADNVDITDTGAIEKRAGYVKTLAGAITGAYATLDFSRLFVVDGGELKAMAGPNAAASLLPGIGATPLHFTEVNDQVFFNNGVERGVILPDNTVLPWDWQAPDAPSVAAVSGNLPAGTYRVRCTFHLPDGRETGAGPSAEMTLTEGQALQVSAIAPGANVYIAPANSTVYQYAGTPSGSTMVWYDSPDALGGELLTNLLHPLPVGADVVQAWRGRIYAAQYFPEADQSAVWFSQPLGYHLFDLAADFLLIPGRVTLLAPHADALVMGTDTRIHAYDGNTLSQLAPYGVVPGWHWCMDGARVLLWSVRGLCAALPFANLTERQVSVAPGLQAGGAVVHQHGRKRYLVALHRGATAFNHP